MMNTSTVADRIIEYFEKEATPRNYSYRLKVYDLKNMLDELKSNAYQTGYESIPESALFAGVRSQTDALITVINSYRYLFFDLCDF